MFANINNQCYIIFFVSIFNQAWVHCGTLKFIDKNLKDNMEHFNNKVDSVDTVFDIGNYNFTEYFRKLDTQKVKSLTDISNSNLQTIDALAKNELTTRNGNSRFLDLFSIIKFENKPCSLQYNFLPITDGTCYHKTECDRLGGLAAGPCAKGFGVCCICKLVIKNYKYNIIFVNQLVLMLLQFSFFAVRCNEFTKC